MHYSVTLEDPDNFNITQKIVPETELPDLKGFNIINKFPYALALVFSDPATSENTAANTAKETPSKPDDEMSP